MKKTLFTLLVLLITLSLHAQDITNKLGATGNYDVTDSADKVLFRVQSDGDVLVNTTSSQGKLSVEIDGSTAIYGNQSSSTGSTYGVYGNSEAATGAGVKGTAGPTGANFGGHFSSSAMDGTGVFGEAHKYGGHFKSTAFPTGVGIYAEGSGAAGLFSGNVGIGTVTPDAALDVHGTVKLLGTWDNTTYLAENVYQAATDGYVIGTFNTNTGRIEIYGLSESNSIPSIIRTSMLIPNPVSGGPAFSTTASVTMPVKKGDYWIITDGASGFITASATINWIPLGQ